jgi:DHA1 family bicyclomycin/chloramphenicol resistance-like MFS transporter
VKPQASLFSRLVLILGALTTFAPLSVDMYLPALPTIAREFSADASHIQLSLSAFLVGYVLCGGFVFSGMFAYISGSSFVFIEQFGVPPEYYGLLFAFHVTGLMIGATINSRLLPRFGSDRMLVAGTTVAAVMGAVVIAVGGTGVGGVVALIIASWLYMPCVTLTGANAAAGGLSEFPKLAGTASALLGAGQFGIGALTAYVVGQLHPDPTVSMALAIGLSGIAAYVSRLIFLRHQAA